MLYVGLFTAFALGAIVGGALVYLRVGAFL